MTTTQLKTLAKKLEKSIREEKLQKYVLKLYITGATPRSIKAITNIRKICEEHLKGRHRIEIMLVLQIIIVAQVFTEPFVLTNGGPANSTTSPVLEIYNAAFTRTDFGLASAWGVSMLVALSAFSILYVIFTRKDLDQA